jgi:hypothetical protein
LNFPGRLEFSTGNLLEQSAIETYMVFPLLLPIIGLGLAGIAGGIGLSSAGASIRYICTPRATVQIRFATTLAPSPARPATSPALLTTASTTALLGTTASAP